jgi:hypothetical protein
MENIKKGLEDTILIIKKCLHDDINQYQVFIELGTDPKVLNDNIINRLETMNYLQGLINNLDKENELDSAVNEAIKEANHVYKPKVKHIDNKFKDYFNEIIEKENEFKLAMAESIRQANVIDNEEEQSNEDKEIEKHWEVNPNFKC